jgi:hypothetical protein
MLKRAKTRLTADERRSTLIGSRGLICVHQRLRIMFLELFSMLLKGRQIYEFSNVANKHEF